MSEKELATLNQGCEVMEQLKTPDERYEEIEKIARERIEKDFPNHPDKELFIWVATAILM